MEQLHFDNKDGKKNMNKDALNALNDIMLQYSTIASYHITDESTKQFLGIKNSTCRFCKKTTPDVSFKKDAHALPHCIGNNVLFTHNECDRCNNKFGRLLENEFAKFMHLNHTISGVRGKNGYPKYKMDDALIKTTGSNIDWSDVPIENIDHNKDAGVIKIKQKIPAFIPVAMYKCFVKMALTLMPENELVQFENTLDWINEENHQNSKYPFENLLLFHGNVATTERFYGISAILVKRMDDTDCTKPYIMFRLTYGTFMFQVPIPLSKMDTEKNAVEFPYIPNLTDLKFGFNKMEIGLMDLHYTESLRGTEMTVTIKDLDGTGTVKYIDA